MPSWFFLISGLICGVLARPDRVVLADGGGQSISAGGSIAVFAGIIVAALAISLLIRFLIALF